MIDALFDTSLMLHYTRSGSPVVPQVEADYQLSASPFRPSVSVVTLGELRAFALGWGPRRVALLRTFLNGFNVVGVDQNDVLDAYAFLHDAVQGLPGRFDQNDLWIAACAKVTGQTLFTLDKGFLKLPANYIRLIQLDRNTGVTETVWS